MKAFELIKRRGENTGVKYMMPCSDIYITNFTYYLEVYLHFKESFKHLSQFMVSPKIATKPKIAQEGNKMKYLTN